MWIILIKMNPVEHEICLQDDDGQEPLSQVKNFSLLKGGTVSQENATKMKQLLSVAPSQLLRDALLAFKEGLRFQETLCSEM